jgi:hypothetical protein
MKTVAAILALIPMACGSDPAMSFDAARPRAESASAAQVLPREARANGRSQVELAEDFQRYLYSVPLADNPTQNAADDCGPGQTGPVYLLPPFPFSGAVRSRTCAVPTGKHVFFVFTGNFNIFPCPDPDFHPAPGQSLEDFLRDGAVAANARINPANFEVIVDGVSNALEPHRITTPLFDVTGDRSLAVPSFDACITGGPQPGVFDGWHFLLAPLSPGEHTVVIRSKVSGGTLTTTLQVEPRG